MALSQIQAGTAAVMAWGWDAPSAPTHTPIEGILVTLAWALGTAVIIYVLVHLLKWMDPAQRETCFTKKRVFGGIACVVLCTLAYAVLKEASAKSADVIFGLFIGLVMALYALELLSFREVIKQAVTGVFSDLKPRTNDVLDKYLPPTQVRAPPPGSGAARPDPSSPSVPELPPTNAPATWLSQAKPRVSEVSPSCEPVSSLPLSGEPPSRAGGQKPAPARRPIR
jgi:hypothetical protein